MCSFLFTRRCISVVQWREGLRPPPPPAPGFSIPRPDWGGCGEGRAGVQGAVHPRPGRSSSSLPPEPPENLLRARLCLGATAWLGSHRLPGPAGRSLPRARRFSTRLHPPLNYSPSAASRQGISFRVPGKGARDFEVGSSDPVMTPLVAPCVIPVVKYRVFFLPFSP